MAGWRQIKQAPSNFNRVLTTRTVVQYTSAAVDPPVPNQKTLWAITAAVATSQIHAAENLWW